MSDLFCPATLILARHAEAETRSDDGDALTAAGHEQAAALPDRLRTHRVANVYSSTSAPAVRTAEIVAAALDLDVSTRAGLQERSPDESDDAVVARLRPVIEEISDLYRGETVLVVAHGDLIRQGVQRLARMAPGVQGGRLGPCATVEIQVDADGILCSAWDHHGDAGG